MTTDIRDMLQDTIEHRTFGGASLELRDAGGGPTSPIRITGYAATTEEGYEVNGSFTETLARGAFRSTLASQPDVILNINHGQGGQLPLARTKSGTLTLAEDVRGLKVDAELDPEDPDARAVAAKIRRGDVDAMSFAFRAVRQRWNDDRSERLIRELSLEGGDVSLVSSPANSATSVSVRRRRGRLVAAIDKPPSYLEVVRARREKLRTLANVAPTALMRVSRVRSQRIATPSNR
jgi:Escherichia/Staphylococcus phage prohead protease